MEVLRDIGACAEPRSTPTPFIKGLETLHLRVRAALARTRWRWRSWLQKHPRVAWVRYPGPGGRPRVPRRARSTSTGGFGGLVAFGVKGGFAAGKALIDRVKLCQPAGQHRRRRAR